ncbi:MAG: Cys-tRNA(Pro) deacylase, partial [Deltaproteobacteria bacterium]
PLPSVMDSRLLSYDRVIINGGQRGIMLKMSPKEITRLLKSEIADIARL